MAAFPAVSDVGRPVRWVARVQRTASYYFAGHLPPPSTLEQLKWSSESCSGPPL